LLSILSDILVAMFSIFAAIFILKGIITPKTTRVFAIQLIVGGIVFMSFLVVWGKTGRDPLQWIYCYFDKNAKACSKIEWNESNKLEPPAVSDGIKQDDEIRAKDMTQLKYESPPMKGEYNAKSSEQTANINTSIRPERPVGNKQYLIEILPFIEASKRAYLNILDTYNKSKMILTEPAINNRINRIFNLLINQVESAYPYTQTWEWEFKIIEAPDVVNVWCLDGGKMAIFTGIFNILSATDDEIAIMMAHEITHVIKKHSEVRASDTYPKSQTNKLFTSQLDSEKEITLSTAAAQLSLTFPYSKTFETEVDRLSLELASNAGFDPYGAVTLWEKVEYAYNTSSVEFLRLHPSPEGRINNFKKLAPYIKSLKTKASVNFELDG
jgi:Zn-dependent protease with chaperone function